jgi:hypothetical protein
LLRRRRGGITGIGGGGGGIPPVQRTGGAAVGVLPPRDAIADVPEVPEVRRGVVRVRVVLLLDAGGVLALLLQAALGFVHGDLGFAHGFGAEAAAASGAGGARVRRRGVRGGRGVGVA